MEKSNEIVIRRQFEESRRYYVDYIRYLKNNSFFFRLEPEQVLDEFSHKIFINVSNDLHFTSILWSLTEFLIDQSFNEKWFKTTNSLDININAKEFLVDKKFQIFHEALDDLYQINPKLAFVSALNFGFHFEAEEISKMFQTSSDLILKDIELSQSFVIGWIVRDKKLEQSLFPMLNEQSVLRIFESALDREVEDQEIQRVIDELDHELVGMKSINIKLNSMSNWLETKAKQLH